RTVVANSATCCSRAPPATGTRTHAVTCALCTSRPATRSNIVSITPSLTDDDNHASPAGASGTDESDGRAHGNSPVSRGRLPHQTKHGLTGTKKKHGVSGQQPDDRSFHPPAYARPRQAQQTDPPGASGGGAAGKGGSKEGGV